MTSGRLYCFHKTQSEFALQRIFPESFVSSSVRRKTLGRDWASLAAMKQSPIWLNAAVNVGSDLQNDSSTDIVVDSSDTALDK